jgi:hypothetical protein
MRLEEQVVSLELAKRLKELGVRQESVLYWCDQDPWTLRMWNEHPVNTPMKPRVCVAAFTVAELGEMLPAEIGDASLGLYKATGDEPFYKAGTWEISCSPSQERSIALAYINTEAGARAKLLIHLLEKELIALPHEASRGGE